LAAKRGRFGFPFFCQSFFQKQFFGGGGVHGPHRLSKAGGGGKGGGKRGSPQKNTPNCPVAGWGRFFPTPRCIRQKFFGPWDFGVFCFQVAVKNPRFSFHFRKVFTSLGRRGGIRWGLGKNPQNCPHVVKWRGGGGGGGVHSGLCPGGGGRGPGGGENPTGVQNPGGRGKKKKKHKPSGGKREFSPGGGVFFGKVCPGPNCRFGGVGPVGAEEFLRVFSLFFFLFRAFRKGATGSGGGGAPPGKKGGIGEGRGGGAGSFQGGAKECAWIPDPFHRESVTIEQRAGPKSPKRPGGALGLGGGKNGGGAKVGPAGGGIKRGGFFLKTPLFGRGRLKASRGQPSKWWANGGKLGGGNWEPLHCGPPVGFAKKNNGPFFTHPRRKPPVFFPGGGMGPQNPKKTKTDCGYFPGGNSRVFSILGARFFPQVFLVPRAYFVGAPTQRKGFFFPRGKIEKRFRGPPGGLGKGLFLRNFFLEWVGRLGAVNFHGGDGVHFGGQGPGDRGKNLLAFCRLPSGGAFPGREGGGAGGPGPPPGAPPRGGGLVF